MPSITNGNAIFAATQVGTDVILSTAIKDGEIVNADINASAAIAGSKIQALSVGANAGVIPSTGITTSHIAANAGIVDTQLATISTAGKVSGAALTSLSSIPGGAGVIPSANVPGGNRSNGTFVKNMSDANTTLVIAHGLGRAPVRVILFGSLRGAGTIGWVYGVWDGSGQNGLTHSSTEVYRVSAVTVELSESTGVYVDGVVSVDATNINIAWTKGGSPTSSFDMVWSAD